MVRVTALCAGLLASCLPFLLLFMVTFLIVLPSLCQHWVFSKYFRGPTNDFRYVEQAVLENDARLEEAEAYFLEQPRHKSQQEGPVHVAIGIITIDRTPAENRHMTGKLGYLTQVAARLHQLTRDEDSMGTKKLFVCNVDADPRTHEEAVYLADYIPVVMRFANTSKKVVQPDVFEKEKQDYAYCMLQALSLNPTYVLMIEDDAIPHENMFRVLEHTLRSGVVHSSMDHSEEKLADPWLFLKLYYPEKWQGYSNDVEKILELVGVAILGGWLFVVAVPVISGLWRRRKSPNGALQRVLHFGFGAVYFVVVAYTVGRVYVQHWRYMSTYTYHLVQAPDCCTQGILYPAHVSLNLVHYLNSVRSTIDFSVDLAIDQYADLNDLKRHLLEPNLMQHIGLVSTVRGYAKGAAEFIFT